VPCLLNIPSEECDATGARKLKTLSVIRLAITDQDSSFSAAPILSWLHEHSISG